MKYKLIEVAGNKLNILLEDLSSNFKRVPYDVKCKGFTKTLKNLDNEVIFKIICAITSKNWLHREVVLGENYMLKNLWM